MPHHKLDMQYGTVNYCEFGDIRKPTIVCIHGLAGNGFYSFGELVPFLKEDFHLITLDMPGHGKTNPFPEEEDYLFSNLAGWLEEAINVILQKPYYIMGHSWGADVALHFSRRFPRNVQGLLLLDGAFTFPQNQPEMTFEYAYAGWTEYLARSVFESENDLFQEYRGYTKKWDSRKEHYTRALFQTSSSNKYELITTKFTVLSIIKAFFKEPFSKAYPDIKIPTVLIHADHPKELTDARTKGILQLKRSINDVAIACLPNSSHMLQWDYPEETAKLVMDWITDKTSVKVSFGKLKHK